MLNDKTHISLFSDHKLVELLSDIGYEVEKVDFIPYPDLKDLHFEWKLPHKDNGTFYHWYASKQISNILIKTIKFYKWIVIKN